MEINKVYLEKTAHLDKLIHEIMNDAYEVHKHICEGVSNKDQSKVAALDKDIEYFHQKASDIENEVVKILALFGPEAKELRQLVAYFKIAYFAAKIGELGVKFSKRILGFMDDGFMNMGIYKDLSDLNLSTLKCVQYARDSIAMSEKSALHETLKHALTEESKTDELFSLITKDIIINNYKEEMYIKASIEFFSAGRRLERAADCAVDVIKLIDYAKFGGMIVEG